MNIEEVRRVLNKAATFDNRKVTNDVVMDWHDVLSGIGVQEAVAAVAEYYATTREWMMPKNLIGIVLRHRREREEAEAKARIRNGRGEHWRNCGTPGCTCSHTHCCNGFLDELETYYPFGPEGRAYQRAVYCPQCRPDKAHYAPPLPDEPDYDEPPEARLPMEAEVEA